MVKTYLKAFFGLMGAVMVAGCSSTSPVQVQQYLENKPRVDQSRNGNEGYLVGTPGKGENLPAKDTRQVYVVEVTKSIPEDANKVSVEVSDEAIKPSSSNSLPKTTITPEPVENPSPKMNIPSFEDEDTGDHTPSPSNVSSDGNSTEYTVEKDDTLQKISQKFYNTHSKWTKIYKANKERIDNPDKIKPGTVLQIPAE